MLFAACALSIVLAIRVIGTATGRLVPLTETGRRAAPRSGASLIGTSAVSLDGRPVQMATLLERPMILDVWATWCPPCRAQRAVLASLAAELEGSVSVVAVSVDENPEAARRYIAEHARMDVELFATPELLDALGTVSALPTLAFVDSTGVVRDVTTGLQSAEEIQERIAKLR